MSEESGQLAADIEKVFQSIGGFTWRDAETWAGFCNAVGMDPLPFLRVMLENVCRVECVKGGAGVPPAIPSATLWIDFKGGKTRFHVAGPSA